MKEKEVVVGDYENEIEAEIAKGHLEASGVLAFVMKDDAGGMFPSLQDAQGVRLVVPEAQREKAIKILATVSVAGK